MRRFSSLHIQEDFHPFSQIKLIRKEPQNDSNLSNSLIVSKTVKDTNSTSVEAQIKKFTPPSPEYRENEFKIQMLSTNLHRQLFPQFYQSSEKKDQKKTLLDTCFRELRRHGIDINSRDIDRYMKDVHLKLPPLAGANIEEHFYAIGEEQVHPYRTLLLSLVNLEVLPPRPSEWCFQEGWTKYDRTTDTAHSVDYPNENALVFDVEVCMSNGNIPTLAVAVGKEHWYSWASSHLIQNRNSTITFRHKLQQKFLHNTLDDLIPLGKRKTPKLIIGHNVSYDRARLREEYLIEDFGTRFLDTMSLHICVSGVTSYQRAQMKSKKESTEEDLMWLSQSSLNNLADVYQLYCGGSEPLSKTERNVFVEGSIDDVRQNFQSLMAYCAQDVVATHKVLHSIYPLFAERFPHPVTLAGMLELGSAYLPINKNWYRYINESDLTYKDLNIEAKYHLSRRADEACTLMKNKDYKQNLWLWDEDWSTQNLKLNQCTSKNTKKSTEVSTDMEKSKVGFSLTSEEKDLYSKFQYLYDLKLRLPVRRPLLPGYPAWYRKLCRKPEKSSDNKLNEESEDLEVDIWSPGSTEISTGMKIAPKLLSLCWEGYPVHYIREHGWGFLVPFCNHLNKEKELNSDVPRVPIEELFDKCPQSDKFKSIASENSTIYTLQLLDKTLDTKLIKHDFYRKVPKKKQINDFYNGSGYWCNHVIDDCCFFLKLPHKNGKSLRVGNPLSRDFINKFSDNVLTSGESGDESANRIIEIARMMSYWRNNRDRIIGQMVVWLGKDEKFPFIDLENNTCEYQWHSPNEYGAICPQVVTCGTLTRRAMEPTWMTASNSQEDRIGSELRAMVQAPPNYRIVGADVDSQELWIASALGDAYAYGQHGATPLGWMTLSGSKTNGTDMHSMTAKAVGISRDHAKVINYARIYGAGQNFAEDLLKQFNPTLSATEARNKAMKMFAITKGKKKYQLKSEYRDDNIIVHKDTGYTSYEAYKLAAAYNRSLAVMFERPKWTGGSESAMFNCLEEIATEAHPVTPFLQSRLSRALEINESNNANRFLPTKINWVVQSGAVDFLHLMLVSMRWLMTDQARFCLSFHDEIRYLVKKDDAYKAALAMHVTNLLTRAFCCSRLGLNDVPMSVAFFSSVEVDTVLRKENTQDCKTPSNPHGLKIGYGISPGESLDIYEAIKKAQTNELTK